MKNKQTLSDWLITKWEEDNLLPPAMSNQEVINFIYDYLLDGWYTISPYHGGDPNQWNTEFVHELLMTYSKKYRKEVEKNAKHK